MGGDEEQGDGAVRTDGRTRILDAACALFLADGFSAVTTDRLSRDAGVSKSTIYKYFGDMGGVLAAVAEREGDVFQAGVTAAAGTPAEFRRSLVAYGTNLLHLLNRERCIQLDRMLHEEARKHPEVARSFYDASYGRSHREVTALLSHARGRGFLLNPQDPADLADNLLSMWNGLSYVRTRLGLSERPYPDPAAWARQCVDALIALDGLGDTRSPRAEGSDPPA